MSLLNLGIAALGAITSYRGNRTAAGGGRSLPGVGSMIGSAAAGGVGSAVGSFFGGGNDGGGYRRRRSRGFSARDIRQARKLVRLASDFSCPGTRTRKAGKKSCR